MHILLYHTNHILSTRLCSMSLIARSPGCALVHRQHATVPQTTTTTFLVPLHPESMRRVLSGCICGRAHRQVCMMQRECLSTPKHSLLPGAKEIDVPPPAVRISKEQAGTTFRVPLNGFLNRRLPLFQNCPTQAGVFRGSTLT